MLTPEDIATALGRSAPEQDTPQFKQWAMWIADADRAIHRRADKVGVEYATLNTEDVDYAIREAVVAHIKHPEDSTQLDVAVDDGRISKRWSSGAGRVSLDDWWDMLGLADPEGSFSISPTYTPDRCADW